MNLAVTPAEQELQASARRFLEKEIGRERLLAWDKTPLGYDAEFWRAVGDLGWLRFTLPESLGGQGGSLLDAALILEECGRAAAPAAVHAAVVGARALGAVANRACDGQVAIAFSERLVSRDISRMATRLDGDRLDGEKWYVRHGVGAELLIVLALERGEPVLVVVPADADGVSRRELQTFGGDRQSVFRFERAPIESRVATGEAARRAVERIEAEATALALAEIVGGFAAVCDMTVAYVKERVQFNQPIGKFQAVQFRCADMATAHAATRHMAFSAIWRLSEGLEYSRELALARAWAGDAYKRATLDAHQLHGGAGYVVEHPLHRYAERAESHAILFASESEALPEIADRLLA